MEIPNPKQYCKEHALDVVACIALRSRDLILASKHFARKMRLRTSPRRSPEAVLEDLSFVLKAVLEYHT